LVNNTEINISRLAHGRNKATTQVARDVPSLSTGCSCDNFGLKYLQC
jgi:hypothetical protein